MTGSYSGSGRSSGAAGGAVAEGRLSTGRPIQLQAEARTEADIRRRARADLTQRLAGRKKETLPAVVPDGSDPLEVEPYRTTFLNQLARARDAGLVLTPQQGADRVARRWLEVGDRARYVGPTYLVQPPSDVSVGAGPGVPVDRPRGQEGHIVYAALLADGLHLVRFQPDSVAVAAPGVTAGAQAVYEGPEEANLLERIPPSDDVDTASGNCA